MVFFVRLVILSILPCAYRYSDCKCLCDKLKHGIAIETLGTLS